MALTCIDRMVILSLMALWIMKLYLASFNLETLRQCDLMAIHG